MSSVLIFQSVNATKLTNVCGPIDPQHMRSALIRIFYYNEIPGKKRNKNKQTKIETAT